MASRLPHNTDLVGVSLSCLRSRRDARPSPPRPPRTPKTHSCYAEIKEQSTRKDMAFSTPMRKQVHRGSRRDEDTYPEYTHGNRQNIVEAGPKPAGRNVTPSIGRCRGLWSKCSFGGRRVERRVGRQPQRRAGSPGIGLSRRVQSSCLRNGSRTDLTGHEHQVTLSSVVPLNRFGSEPIPITISALKSPPAVTMTL